MKDDSGSHAVFTEQGSSASQMTAAEFVDVIARLPRCEEQASDAVSAYTHIKIKDDPTPLELPKSEYPDIRIRIPRYKWPKVWHIIEKPVVLLERSLYGHSLAGLLWRHSSKRFYYKLDGKHQRGNACSCIVSKVDSCQCTCTTLDWRKATQY